MKKIIYKFDKSIFALSMIICISMVLLLNNFVSAAELSSGYQLYARFDHSLAHVGRKFVNDCYYIDDSCDLLSDICCCYLASAVDSNGVQIDTYAFYCKKAFNRVREFNSDYESGDRLTSEQTPALVFVHDFDSGTALFNCYVFDSENACKQFINGEIDASSALNYDVIQDMNRVDIYDDSLPYYDITSLSLNTSNQSCLLDANMSETQRNIYTSFPKEVPFNIELYTHAIYAKTKDLGNFNAFCIMYGYDNSLGNHLPNAQKVDDLIKFDSNGRLIVNGEHGYVGGGGRHGSTFTISETSPLLAYTFDQITYRDGLSASVHFTRDIVLNDAEKYFDGYQLIGYMTEICISHPNGSEISYGRKTYSYTWLTKALRDRYGSQSTYYDGEGLKIEGESYTFDEYGNQTTVDSSNVINDGNVIDYIKNGFGLLGSQGVIQLAQTCFVGVPSYLWALYATLISVNIVLIIFKITRGF